MKYLKKFWPTLIISVVGSAALVVSFGYPLIDVPPPHIDKYDWKRNFPEKVFLPMERDMLDAQLWISRCDKFKEENEKVYLLIASGEPYGNVFTMDCYGNVDWPHGQEIGANFLREVLGMGF